MSEERLTISSSSRLHPDEVARHTFATTRRGFDPAEVRAYLEQVARELSAAADREHELRRAVSEADHRAANPVLDEATLTSALGQETARVLRSAHDAASELLARAEHDAARMRSTAQEEADQLQRRSEQAVHDRAAQSDAAAAELRRRAQEEVSAKIDGARLEADSLVSQARAECRAMVQEAQELRARVLADLTRRRRVLHSQIEQLRAGRERLAETIGDVRHAVDQITDELFRAEDEARLAAEAAGRQAAQEDLPEVAQPEYVNGEEPAADHMASVGMASVGEASVGEAPVGEAPMGEAPVDEVPVGGVAVGAVAEASGAQAVEDLFARLRAEAETKQRTKSIETVRPPQELPTPPVGQPKIVRLESHTGDSEPSPAATQAVPAAEVGTDDSAAHDGPDASDSDGQGTPSALAAADPFLARRDEIIAPLVATLARRLKRALQDDQNDILDRLRAKGGWAPEVLPSTDEHQQRYVAAAIGQLTDAAHAGAVFAGGKPDDAPAVDAVAVALATDVIGPLRRRLEGEGLAVEAGDEAALVELVGAAFREWKGARVERLAGDQAVLAFSEAELAVVPDGTDLRWIVDDEGADCPDCDDNALAGAIRAGEAFPTGHPHPPAHAGCRCLLAPASP
jgi:DivIVA domain-containing protein